MIEQQMHAEQLEQKRSKWLLINLLGFILWDGIRILQGYILKTEFSLIFTPLELLGWLLWAISLIQILRLGKNIKANPLLQDILNDELVRLNRMQAWKTGFIVVLSTQIILLLVHLFYPFSAALGAEVTIFLGVVSSIAAFMRLS
ncbi:hypothetical protein [Catalinimonas niigatensis]|uniref:hypothetical protein n=1 Tax=Catalinimonas niigatensis TaxID=1397264 RepID=UPI0026655552|nr:hypothetical protein [Catalinimonas niigatensis]WPP50197.1 hypothetical protein PZB72_26385 [Catalinimonas niigatensis]